MRASFAVPMVFLMLLGASLLVADPALTDAARADDAQRVQSLILDGMDLNASDETGATPLYYAIVNGNVEIVRMLLEAGANPNSSIIPEGPGFGWGSDALALALSRSAFDVADALLASGANPVVLDNYRAYQVQRAIADNDLGALDGILSRFPADLPTLTEVLWYQQGDPELQGVLGRHFPMLSDGTYGLVDALRGLVGGHEVAYFTTPEVGLPAATSELQDSRVADRYSADKAVDGRLETSWVEGVDGPGFDQAIVFAVPRDASAVDVYPGYGVDRYYEPNNRVRSAELRLFVLVRGPTEIATVFTVEPVATRAVLFEDRPAFQTIPLELPEVDVPPEFGTLLGELTILDVYAGSRWDDTCVAEIRFR